MGVFVWSIYNGATYYIDVFGKRFQNELEQLKKDVAKWQTGSDSTISPTIVPKEADASVTPQPMPLSLGAAAALDGITPFEEKSESAASVISGNIDNMKGN